MNNQSPGQPEGYRVSIEPSCETPSLIHAYCEILRNFRKRLAYTKSDGEQHLRDRLTDEMRTFEQLLQQLMPRWPEG